MHNRHHNRSNAPGNSNFNGLKKGTFKAYIKNSDKIPSYYTPQQAAAYILRHKNSGHFTEKTVKRARLVRMAGAKSRARRAARRTKRR